MMARKIALVTGASRGIGAASAIHLGRNGYAVAVNYLENKSAAESVVASIKKEGGMAISFQADIGNQSQIINLFKEIDNQLGPVSALVNNAAVNRTQGSGSLEELPMELIELTFRTNVFGVFLTCKEAVARMKVNGGGSIVNITSEAAKFGGVNMSHYAASKAAVNTMTIALAREVAKYNIRANVISPGVIDTDAHLHATNERMAQLKTSIPLGRLGTPEEVANAILWLLSDESSYVSGGNIPITGGR